MTNTDGSTNKITIGAADPACFAKFIETHCAEYNIKHGVAPLQPEPCCFAVTTSEGEECGVLTGEIARGWLYIAELVVAEKFRSSGYGKSLLQAAEADARAKGCTGIYLWTHSWHAPEFYEKFGYERFATLPDFPEPHQRIGLLKRISGQGV